MIISGVLLVVVGLVYGPVTLLAVSLMAVLIGAGMQALESAQTLGRSR